MKKRFIAVFVFCAFIGLSGMAAFAAAQSNSPVYASQLSLKERWMRVPAELRLTPQQTMQFEKYASALHHGIIQDHHEMLNKLSKILTPDQMKGLREWGEAYRKKGEERTLASDSERAQALNSAAKALQFTANQEQEFKMLVVGFHREKQELFNNFSAKFNKILTASQRMKFEEMKDEL